MYSYLYERPSVACDIVVYKYVLNEPQVLMIKRKNEPYKDMLALPGGYMNLDEVLVQCAARELKEETNLTVDTTELFSIGVFDGVDRDPRGRTISHVFACEYHPEHGEVIGGDDAYDPKWYDVKALLTGKSRLAFDHYLILLSTHPRIR